MPSIPFVSKFSAVQDELLKEMYPRATKEELLKAFSPFMWNTLVRRAERLEIKRDLSYIHSQRDHEKEWSEEEFKIMRENYSKVSIYEMMRLLPGRTRGAITRQACIMKLKRDKDVSYNKDNKVFIADRFWVEEERQILLNLSSKYETRDEVILEFKKLYKDRTDASIISQLSLSNILFRENIKLSSGTLLSEYIRGKEIPITYAYQLFKERGEEFFLDYYENHYKKSNGTDIEVGFFNLMKDIFPNIYFYRSSPQENNQIKKMPDFRLELNNRVLYVNLDGLFWHSEKAQMKNKNGKVRMINTYHLDLREELNRSGLNIFQIRADELKNSSKIVKSIIYNYFNINSRKIDARKCAIKKLKEREMRDFLSENHLMSYCASTGYGLFFEEELVSLISIRRMGEEGIVEIARSCSKLNCTVRGGFSKLLKHIKQEYRPTKIVSFCDLRYSIGKSYEKLGFKLEGITLGWKWTNGRETFNRLHCRANMDGRNLSEKEYAEEMKLYKIYDAGQAKYVLDI